jgi:hypothetical protein
MVTLVYTGRSDIQVAWVLTYRTYEFTPFKCLGDHGMYCPIRFGGE